MTAITTIRIDHAALPDQFDRSRPDAVAAAIAKWQDWRIPRATERSDGIPAGLPYLTGWVQHFAVTASMEEQH